MSFCAGIFPLNQQKGEGEGGGEEERRRGRGKGKGENDLLHSLQGLFGEVFVTTLPNINKIGSHF